MMPISNHYQANSGHVYKGHREQLTERPAMSPDEDSPTMDAEILDIAVLLAQPSADKSSTATDRSVQPAT
jgi:hypothetical protein